MIPILPMRLSFPAMPLWRLVHSAVAAWCNAGESIEPGVRHQPDNASPENVGPFAFIERIDGQTHAGTGENPVTRNHAFDRLLSLTL
jgi:hypothetical protein